MLNRSNIDNAYIIGGGITGIAAALHLSEFKNIKINIFERTSFLGGSLRDISDENDNVFFKDTQYINKDSPLLSYIDPSLFYEFDHIYGSYTSFNGQDIATKSFAGPVFPSNYLLDRDFLESNKIVSCLDYINQYPSPIRGCLNEFLKRFCDPGLVHYSCLTGFNLGRVSIDDKFDKIQKLKNKNSFYDSIYGLPRYYRGLDTVKSLLPNSKYNILFDKVNSLFGRKNITTHFNSSVSISSLNENLENLIVKVNGKKLELENSIIIWTSDPNPLFRLFGSFPKSKPVRMKNLYFKREGSDLSPMYIQVFSSEIPITRIYSYKNLVTVESLFSNISNNLLITLVKKIMNNFLPGISFSPVKSNLYSVNDNRFVLYTPQEEEKMRDLYKILPKSSIFCSPWFSYGRDKKIRSLFNQIDNLLL